MVFCTQQYHQLIAALPGEQSNEEQIKLWWYLFWDFQTGQYAFFKVGLLHNDTYQLWMRELVAKHAESPAGHPHMGSYGDAFKSYSKSEGRHNSEFIAGFEERIR